MLIKGSTFDDGYPTCSKCVNYYKISWEISVDMSTLTTLWRVSFVYTEFLFRLKVTCLDTEILKSSVIK